MNENLKEKTSTMQINTLRDNLEERIDLRTGRVVLDHTDFEWGGELMPVSIHHVYNSAISNVQYTRSTNYSVGFFRDTKLGLGWKLNIMQSMVPKTVDSVTKYYYTDGEGNTTEFIPMSTESLYCSVDNEETVYDSNSRKLTNGNYVYEFAEHFNYLLSITDVERNISMSINYDNTKITFVTDGAGREFHFAYNSDGYLETITAPDNSYIKYKYSDTLDSNGSKVLASIKRYGSENLNGVYVQSEILKYYYLFAYSGTKSKIRVFTDIASHGSITSITPENTYYFGTDENPDGNDGEKLTKIERHYDNGTKSEQLYFRYSYLSNSTSVDVMESLEDMKFPKTTYIFDEKGDILCEYVTLSDGSIHEVSTGCQPVIPNSAEIINVIGINENLIANHSFNNSYIPSDASSKKHIWLNNNDVHLTNDNICNDESYAMYGKKSLILNSINPEAIEQGFHQVLPLKAGEYTFSAYVRIADDYDCSLQNYNSGVYLRISKDGVPYNISETIQETGIEFIRISTSLTLNEDSNNVHFEILQNGKGKAYVSCPMVNNSNTVEEYNLIETGGTLFSLGDWTLPEDNFTYSTQKGFKTPNSIVLMCNTNECAEMFQYVYPKKAKDTVESYVFSAWANVENMLSPTDEENTPTFHIGATINYSDNTSETFTKHFINATNTWQKAELHFEKSKLCEVDSIKLFCNFDYHNEDCRVYLDNFELYREDIVRGIVSNEQNEYQLSDSNENLSYFKERVDEKGNILTDTIFSDNRFGTLYRSFAFSYNGNDKISETDTRGNITTYEVCDKNSRITSVTDRCGNITEYEYDSNGNVSKVIRKDSSGNVCSSVDYTHNANGNVTNITRGDGKEFNFVYNTQGLLTNAAGMVTYDYKLSSGRLKSMTYSNGSTVALTYDRFGRITGEKWKNGEVVEYDYKYVYGKDGNICSSIDRVKGKEYNYYYSNGNVVRISENAVGFTEDGIINLRTSVSSIKYTYDSDGRIHKKEYPSSGLKVYYNHSDNGDTCIKYLHGNTIAELHTETDHLGRLKTEEVRTGNGLHYRTFEYVKGEITDEHKPEYDAEGNLVKKGKIVSNPTTNLVSAINLSNRTLTYGYDEEERITYHKDYRAYANTYTYDAQGQLTSHSVEDDTTYYEYDSYGNILAKGPILGTDGKLDRESTQNCFYTYTDHDKLISYSNGTNTYSFAYDTLGNPTTYKGKTLVWEKGRQLKEYRTKASYTYNANGIRTSRTLADGTVYNYELEGSKIVKVTCGENILVPLYDNNDSPIGIIHNGKFYWYAKNLQGDVLAIRDETDYDVVRYNYDAWGKVQINRDYSGCNLALLNPFLYRGYVYDYETKLYYLQSRYYDPEIGRFLNADNPELISYPNISNNCNLYAYCENDPVNNVDISGELLAQTIARVILGIMIGFAVQLISDLIDTWLSQVLGEKEKKFIPEEYFSSMLSWALTCVSVNGKMLQIVTAFLPVVIKHVGKALRDDFDLLNLAIDSVIASAGFFLSKHIDKNLTRKINKAKKMLTANKFHKKLNTKIRNIKLKGKICGIKLNLSINITNFIASVIYGYIIKEA